MHYEDNHCSSYCLIILQIFAELRPGTMEELRKHLATYLSPEAGLVGVLLSDREGVPLLRVTTDQVSRASKMLRNRC